MDNGDCWPRLLRTSTCSISRQQYRSRSKRTRASYNKLKSNPFLCTQRRVRTKRHLVSATQLRYNAKWIESVKSKYCHRRTNVKNSVTKTRRRHVRQSNLHGRTNNGSSSIVTSFTTTVIRADVVTRPYPADSIKCYNDTRLGRWVNFDVGDQRNVVVLLLGRRYSYPGHFRRIRRPGTVSVLIAGRAENGNCQRQRTTTMVKRMRSRRRWGRGRKYGGGGAVCVRGASRASTQYESI